MRSPLLCLLLTLMVVSCRQDFSSLQNNAEYKSKIKNSVIKVPFETYLHYRALSAENTKPQLIVMKDQEDQKNFLDTTSIVTWFPSFESYDSLNLAGIIYDQKVRANSIFSIDSILMDTTTNEINIIASIYKTNDERFPFSIPCCFVSIPKVDGVFKINKIIDINECDSIKIIPFRTVIKGHQIFYSNSPYPEIIVLRNEEDQRAFLDTTATYGYIPPFSFPDFNYTDSLIIGIIHPEVFTSLPFEINALLLKTDSLSVYAQKYYWGGVFPDPGHPCHFVGIKRENAHIFLKEIQKITFVD
ncbi:MAG: hypothetical protein P8184_21660 [Calditrichia bacterium]